jgi:hypothetical protein
MASSPLLVSLDRCQVVRRSNSSIWAFSIRSWTPSAARHARATSGSRQHIEQLINTVASDRRDNPELGKMG